MDRRKPVLFCLREGQCQLESDCQYTRAEDGHSPDPGGERGVNFQLHQDDVNPHTEEGAGGIQPRAALEYVGNLVTEHIAQDTAENTGHHAHQGYDQQGKVHLQRIGRSQNSEETQPQRIRDVEPFFGYPMYQVEENNRDREGRDG